jgi:hypothetical protein
MAIKLRWCPTHKGVPRNEKANDWAKLTADEPDAHGVEEFSLDFLCYFLGALYVFVIGWAEGRVSHNEPPADRSRG